MTAALLDWPCQCVAVGDRTSPFSEMLGPAGPTFLSHVPPPDRRQVGEFVGHVDHADIHGGQIESVDQAGAPTRRTAHPDQLGPARRRRLRSLVGNERTIQWRPSAGSCRCQAGASVLRHGSDGTSRWSPPVLPQKRPRRQPARLGFRSPYCASTVMPPHSSGATSCRVWVSVQRCPAGSRMVH